MPGKSRRSSHEASSNQTGADSIYLPDVYGLYGNAAMSGWLRESQGPDLFGPYGDLSGDDRAPGMASSRISRHYGAAGDPSQMTPEERSQELDLHTDEGRLAALGNMRQNADPISKEGGMRCGASSLVGGVVYGGGKQGVQVLLDSIAKERSAKGLDPMKADGLEALRERLADPDAKLTMGDLDVASSATYRHFELEGGGTNGRDLQKFIENNEKIKEMFENRNMGLDSIDTSGNGRGNHLVLGIGKNRNGQRDMIFDPQARQDKENWGQFMDPAQVEQIRLEEHQAMAKQKRYQKLQEMDPYDKHGIWRQELDAMNQARDDKIYKRQYKYKHDSQLVTNASELRDYHLATDYRATAGGVEELDAQTYPGA